jgi:hypothetical protein
LNPQPKIVPRNASVVMTIQNPKSKIQNPEEPANALERRLVELRGRISDIGYEIDSGKAAIGMLMGGGIFLLLLALLAAYDLANGKASIYAPLGITRDLLTWIAGAGGILGAAAILKALHGRGRHGARAAELAELVEEYARLKEHHEASASEEE